MIRCLLTGTLHGEPQTRVSAKGTSFTTARMRCDDGKGGTVWVSMIAFNDEAPLLARLKDKAALAVSGRATPKAWLSKDGEPQAGLDVVIDQIAPLKAKPKPKVDRPAPSSSRPSAAPFNDLDDWQP